VIDISNVKFTYDGTAFALNGISAHVARGEFLCILGGNGSGKSTLAKHLNALLLPDEGTVAVNGMDTADANCTYLIRKTAGMVFQNPDDQLVASLVEDDVAFGPENLGLEPAELRKRVTAALEDVGLSGFERHETHALSGGQKQRVAIAGVLAMDPQVLILDEASAMLDPRGRAGLMRVCKELHGRGFTIIMITHFMEEAAAADRVMVMEAGRVALCGTPQEVLTRADELTHLNLDVPFATRLSLDLRTAGVAVEPTVCNEALASSLVELASTKGIIAAEACPNSAGDVDTAAQTPKPAGNHPANSPADSPEKPASSNNEPVAAPAATDSNALIAFENVSYTYDAAEAKRQRKRNAAPAAKQAEWGNSPDNLWAVCNVNFSVRAGEFLGIAGHTGSGKSTIIQHMNGILKPTSGRVLVEGRDIADKRVLQDIRGTIGVVFQYPEHQLFAETVYKDVAFGPRNLGIPESEVDDLVRISLERVGLSPDDICEKSPFELSGGQQRRVAFAGVLAMDPKVLVLDEPAAGLDPASRRSFLNMIARLHEEGLTVVMVSHNMDDLADMCDRVAVMNEGRLLGIDAPGKLFLRADELKRVGLGTTEPQAFATALAAGGFPISTDTLLSESDLVQLITKELN
jgi:energy-coupling factor transport system ATP-binding protein